MKRILVAALGLAMAAAPLTAQDTASSGVTATDAAPDASLTVLERWRADPTTIFDGSEVELEPLLWQARVLVVFAQSEFDPNFQQQMELITRGIEDMAERDVLVVVDTDPDAENAVRIRVRPRGFMLALIGKDGEVKLRKPLPWDTRELSRSIDKMPLRQQEIRDRREERS